MPNLFNKKILNSRIKDYSVENIDEKIEKIKNWQQSLSKIKGLNEKRLQSAFLKAIFEDILGYENSPQKEEWTLDIEATTDVDAKHPDGILGFFERVDNEEIRGHEGVIELKGPQISLDKDQKRQGTTYKSPVDQAFSYTNKLDKCKWVIVSNFMEIRLYKVGRSKEYYEVFLLDELDQIENFKRFYYLLNKNNLLSKTGESVTYKLSEKTLKKEEDISVKFYNLYKDVRINLFEHLKENNTKKKPELLLEKAQKFLDRIIFIGFCEDKGLLPNDLLHEAIQRGKDSFSPGNTAVWDQIRGVFRSIDEGNSAHNINAYNGGLFKYDNDLDGLVIENNFFKAIYKISDYDFDSDVDVNILGHIFEQSISDLEKLKSDIRDDEFDKSESKRKKDGIFYTPQYITSYIVENAIGGYLEDLKEDLGYYELPDIENAGSDSWETRYTNQHLEFYNKYEEKLKEIKVLDPACGSGAFLNQAFDYLLEEHNWLNKQRDLLKGGQSSIFALDAIQRNILKNNIFGVDLNEESVEITKLSLWLKTANKRKALTNLDDNIKCGNSLIDDPKVAGDKAFKWKNEFEDIINNGGFDVVIGNPPYVRHEKIIKMKSYFEKHYSTYSGTSDLYVYFFEKGFKLLKDDGYFSFIVSNKFTRTDYGKNLRKYLLNYEIKKYVYNKNEKIFESAEVDPCIIVIKKSKPKKDHNLKYNKVYNVYQKYLTEEGWYFVPEEVQLLKNKISEKGEKLKSWEIEVNRGILTGLNEAFMINKELKEKLINNNNKEIIKPILRGSNIRRYSYDKNDEWLIFTRRGININNYPVIKNYLNNFYEDLKPRNNNEERGRKPGKYKWFEIQDTIKYYKEFEKPKISWPMISTNKSSFTFVEKNIYLNNKCYLITGENLFYILGVLNSSLSWFYFLNNEVGLGSESIEIREKGLLGFSIPRSDNLNEKITLKSKKITEFKNELRRNKLISFNCFLEKYTSQNNSVKLNSILKNTSFSNEIYSGRASKIRNFTVNINTDVITIYLDRSISGKYEVLKFEENNKNKRKYIKYYLENLTDKQLDEVDNKYKGNILKKILQIEIPDYNKDHVVEKVVNEWNNLQQEIVDLENEIEKIDNEIDQMVYRLYDLNEEEIKIVENS